MSDHLTPLQVCEAVIGPLPVLERIAGKRPKAGYAWRREAHNRRSGDLTPDAMRRIWRHVERNKLPIKPEWLIAGAPRSEVDAVRIFTTAPQVAAQ